MRSVEALKKDVEESKKEERQDLKTPILTLIQTELHVPKSDYNRFGKYNYRKAETILEAVKPLLKKYNAKILLTDSIEFIGERYYLKVVASFSCGEEQESVTAYARESETKKGMDDAQITGSASSYARKYALQGLLLIDDGKDPDNQEDDVEFTEKHTRPQTRGKTPVNPQTIKDPFKAAQMLFKEGFEWSSDEVKVYHKYPEFRQEWQRLKGIKAETNNSQEAIQVR